MKIIHVLQHVIFPSKLLFTIRTWIKVSLWTRTMRFQVLLYIISARHPSGTSQTLIWLAMAFEMFLPLPGACERFFAQCLGPWVSPSAVKSPISYCVVILHTRHLVLTIALSPLPSVVWFVLTIKRICIVRRLIRISVILRRSSCCGKAVQKRLWMRHDRLLHLQMWLCNLRALRWLHVQLCQSRVYGVWRI